MSRRMFHSGITETDDFYDLSLAAQSLYFHLCMKSDDDGLSKSLKGTIRAMGLKDNSASKELEEGNYIIILPSGVVAIRDWAISNKVEPSKYTPSRYEAEKKLLDGEYDKHNRPTKPYTILKTANSKSENKSTEFTPTPSDQEECVLHSGNIAEYFNQKCDWMSHVTSKEVTGTVSRLILYEGADYPQIQTVIDKAASSNYLKNKADFKPDFFWIMKPENFKNILSGKYD